METPKTILLPDGYSGHKRLFFAEPIAQDGELVKLRCAESGKQYMTAWKRHTDVKAAEPFSQIVIEYTPQLNITNTQFLAPGLGLKYLEVIEAHIPGVYIAKKWRRTLPQDASIVIDFTGVRHGN